MITSLALCALFRARAPVPKRPIIVGLVGRDAKEERDLERRQPVESRYRFSRGNLRASRSRSQLARSFVRSPRRVASRRVASRRVVRSLSSLLCSFVFLRSSLPALVNSWIPSQWCFKERPGKRLYDAGEYTFLRRT